MSAFRSGLKRCIALVGLCAVLLGALEHEDLILQPEPGAAQVLPACGLVTAQATEPGAPSGTQGTFRSEEHRFWLLPKHESRAWAVRATPQSPASSWARAFRLVRDERPRLIGWVALRL